MSYNDEHSPNQNFQTNKACTSLFRIYMHLFKNVQKQPIEVFCEKKDSDTGVFLSILQKI